MPGHDDVVLAAVDPGHHVGERRAGFTGQNRHVVVDELGGDSPAAGFVLLGGLVPALLCAGSPWRHAGTTDVDVQVDLEIASGAVQAARLEQALRNAEIEPDAQRVWRWNLTDPSGVRTVVKFELLADLDTEPEGATVVFAGCDQFGAANLRGTGYAAKDTTIHQLRAKDHGTWRLAEINVTGLAGFLLAKTAAANSRRKTGTTSLSCC